jgi:carboxymethylenebutenolidase
MTGRQVGTALAVWVAGWLIAGAAGPVAAEVRVETVSWVNPADDTEVPALLFHDPALARPDGTLPGMVFLPARRGLQDAEREYLSGIAALGWLVVAPDWLTARLIPPWPVAHDPDTERDAGLALDFLEADPRVRSGEGRALYGYSRGGYYAVRIASGALEPRWAEAVACVVTISGHFQDPNAPEPAQVYDVMPELSRLSQPLLMVVAGGDVELRVVNNARAFYALSDRGHDAELVVLPMARRAFDLRAFIPGSTETPEEASAARYARAKVAAFLDRCRR